MLLSISNNEIKIALDNFKQTHFQVFHINNNNDKILFRKIVTFMKHFINKLYIINRIIL